MLVFAAKDGAANNLIECEGKGDGIRDEEVARIAKKMQEPKMSGVRP